MIKSDPDRVADLCVKINKAIAHDRTIDGLDALIQIVAYLISRTGRGAEYNEENFALAHKDLKRVILRYLDRGVLQ